MKKPAKKKIILLGSTGSIGTQALDIVRKEPTLFEVIGLSAGKNDVLLREQAEEFHVKHVVLASRDGEQAVEELARLPEADLIVNAIIGFAGLKPTIAALSAGKNVALANKESLVVAGALVMQTAREHGVMIIPIDSELSAITQCLGDGEISAIQKVTLTCSGGPFRGKKKDDLAHVTVEQALAHPTWSMGRKISIDSATLMNKGFEIIETYWLFSLPLEKIGVVVHPQSYIHAFVEYVDGNIVSQMGPPDMHAPIQFALTYPRRINSRLTTHHSPISELTFEIPDEDTFECLRLAKQALTVGGTMPVVLNAANEVAVEKFLNNEIAFLDIPRLVREAMDHHSPISNPSIDDIVRVDEKTRMT